LPDHRSPFSHQQDTASFLKGVTPAVVGLLVAAGISIGRAGIHSWVGMLIAVIAGVVLVRFRPNAIWVILGAGLVRSFLASSSPRYKLAADLRGLTRVKERSQGFSDSRSSA